MEWGLDFIGSAAMMALLSPARRKCALPTAAATSYTTTFVSDENPLSETGKWLNGQTDGLDWRDFQISGGFGCAAHTSSEPPPPYDDSIAQLKTTVVALSANHYIQGVVHKASGYSPSGTHELGLFVRMAITAHGARGYEAYVNHLNNHTVVRWNGTVNDFTPLDGSNIRAIQVPADGDVVRMEASGSTISFYQNSILITQITDTTYTTGQVGLQSYLAFGGGGTASSYSYSSIIAGNL